MSQLIARKRNQSITTETYFLQALMTSDVWAIFVMISVSVLRLSSSSSYHLIETNWKWASQLSFFISIIYLNRFAGCVSWDPVEASHGTFYLFISSIRPRSLNEPNLAISRRACCCLCKWGNDKAVTMKSAEDWVTHDHCLQICGLWLRD